METVTGCSLELDSQDSACTKGSRGTGLGQGGDPSPNPMELKLQAVAELPVKLSSGPAPS